jgi:hypothetical protein
MSIKTVKIISFGMIILVHANVLNAQNDVYIINDKDGYTNIRKEPNTKSQIVGKVCKYQVFFSIHDFCGSELFATENWEPVSSEGNPDGFIYLKKMIIGYVAYSYYLCGINNPYTHLYEFT